MKKDEITVTEKKCSKCHEIKPASEFSLDRSRKSGLQPQCKSCKSIAKPKEQLPEGKKRCTKCKKIKDVDEFGKSTRRKDGLRLYCKLCRRTESDPETDKERKRKWYLENRELTIERSRIRHIEKREERNKYLKGYYKDNPHIYTWRGLVYRTLNGKIKDGDTLELLGYTYNELKEHIESLFTDEMTWSNYGEWHVDHIIPLSKFDETTPIHIVNALSNLQPLWATTREINGVVYEGNLNKGFS